MLPPARVERRAPTLLVVPRELEVIALASHADWDGTDARPRVEPGPQDAKSWSVGQGPQISEPERRHEEPGASVATPSISITVDVYGHLVPGANRAAVNRLDERPTGTTIRNLDATRL